MTSRHNNMAPFAATHAPDSPRRMRYRTTLLMLSLMVLAGGEAAAEFHVWHDAAGHRHVSTVPARGYRTERTLRPGYDPNSIVYQHRRMRERLQLLAAQLDEQAALAQREAGADQPTSAPPQRRAPREGVMNLDELIALEKRGGRWVGDDAAQGGATRTK